MAKASSPSYATRVVSPGGIDTGFRGNLIEERFRLAWQRRRGMSADLCARQIVRAMHLLASLQLEQKQFADAEKTFEDLADLSQVPPSVRHEAKLSAARMGITAAHWCFSITCFPWPTPCARRSLTSTTTT